ncbi:DUF4265 domain-containing protein [Jatrophihabitans telluris]|uniref:DUF4265 domain-containing protein n=1 Tax=Jatrophihabitans telluris TaxID=2038343 RepID=A0ABY4R196_9ACTN|nr:DUF4265 domain-containing protein [Jatrophihabitans telluris]UQX89257.1 DUF4265 domain-containing protein [Jatrophihabitans telluris]
MADETMIATHDEPAARARTNYILRLSLADDGLPGRYEQMWTRTDDKVNFELCCIPFFTYGLSLGDVLTTTDDDGSYKIVSKGGHRTIRFAIQNETFLHEAHDSLHGSIAGTGCLVEFRGHMLGYGAIDIVEDRQSEVVRGLLSPLAEQGLLMWEWADPAVPD